MSELGISEVLDCLNNIGPRQFHVTTKNGRVRRNGYFLHDPSTVEPVPLEDREEIIPDLGIRSWQSPPFPARGKKVCPDAFSLISFACSQQLWDQTKCLSTVISGRT